MLKKILNWKGWSSLFCRNRNLTLSWKETMPTDFYKFQDFQIYWSGWKRELCSERIVGHWVAWDKNFMNGYVLTLPGFAFHNTNRGCVFDLSMNTFIDEVELRRNRKFRNQLIKDGKTQFENHITEEELKRMMNSAGDEEGHPGWWWTQSPKMQWVPNQPFQVRPGTILSPPVKIQPVPYQYKSGQVLSPPVQVQTIPYQWTSTAGSYKP